MENRLKEKQEDTKSIRDLGLSYRCLLNRDQKKGPHNSIAVDVNDDSKQDQLCSSSKDKKSWFIENCANIFSKFF